MAQALTDIQRAKALQQPEWPDPAQVQRVREILSSRPPLVRVDDVHTLRSRLASVAAGEALVVQSGDCAEDPQECTAGHVRRKTAVLDLLASTLKMLTGKPVLRVGRMAGQFAKPRSNDFEQIGDLALPVYRGHMVNSPVPCPESRRPDPLRILTGYMAAGDIMEHLGWRAPALRTWPGAEPLVWTSHEALLLDYEVPMVRDLGDSTRWLGSTHWPWIGERTRQLDGAHMDLLSDVVNPVACKVGPSMTPEELTSLCERLDPLREPGRLTLISRMGADAVGERLPALVTAVRSAGHPVIWLCDPMHGNTITAPGGRKTRLLTTMASEVQRFGLAVAAAGGTAGGLHLETTPDDVTECAADASALGRIGERHTTFCDPRLNSRQAVSLVTAWANTL
ncbi:3-deoxy-7-phosphoheptulonate synthase [Streptomyces canus]|uniref:3-deoxy-7-phosphoheptulonate synthase n=1 Tax=Streptomyces canus TaxID=58343 RepID=UPI00277E43DC|nr:3-deoxy-7-phosphoheptulonate synthase [Streptomyces canus]MDQ0598293.1 3-deoxy-7-phosphoheptulonate synthase [Streptomyces canus]